MKTIQNVLTGFASYSEAAKTASDLRDPKNGIHTSIETVRGLGPVITLVINIPEPVQAPADKPALSYAERRKAYADALAAFVEHVQSLQTVQDWASYEGVLLHNGNILPSSGIKHRVHEPKRFTLDGRNLITVNHGRVYDKIVSHGSGQSVHCFVRKDNGDVLKSASWAAPAKHARGSIFGDTSGYGVGSYGANYIR